MSRHYLVFQPSISNMHANIMNSATMYPTFWIAELPDIIAAIDMTAMITHSAINAHTLPSIDRLHDYLDVR